MPQRRKKWSRIKSTLEAMFDHRIDNPKSQKRSLLYAKWFDVGFLRVAWTNEGQVVDGLLRSNNPTQARYEDYAARGIRTVLNLRNDTHLAPPKLSARRLQAAWHDIRQLSNGATPRTNAARAS